MNKLVIGIFAHPDDESFGPSGTFIKMHQEGYETHVITATDGSLGGDQDNLVEIRRAEIKAATKHLMLNSHHSLNYEDGQLCNAIYHKIIDDLVHKINRIIDGREVDLTFITFDRGGVSGHIDHITMSMITSYIYQRYSTFFSTVTNIQLMYYCIDKKHRPFSNPEYFVFGPAGYQTAEIDIINDVTKVLEQKKLAIKAHASQNPEYILGFGDERLSKECFLLPKDIKFN